MNWSDVSKHVDENIDLVKHESLKQKPNLKIIWATAKPILQLFTKFQILPYTWRMVLTHLVAALDAATA